MSLLLRQLRAFFRAKLAIIVEYRAEVYIWTLAGVTPIVMMLVWMNIAGPDLGGRAPEDFARYFLIAFLVGQLTQTWIVWELDFLIRTGTFSNTLLKPYDPWWDQAVENIAGNGFRLPVTLAIVALGLSLTGAWQGFDLSRLPLFLFALVLAWFVAINLSYAMALLALWTERIKSADGWNYMALAVLGGQVFPLDLLPAALAGIVDLTPYPWIIGFPVSLAVNDMAREEIVRGIAMQILWIAVFVVLHRVLWRRGIRRFGAVGG
jgi:ABC-2 type transport system permease protein